MRRSVIAVVSAPPLVFLSLAALVYAWVRIEPAPRLSPEQRAAVVGALRSAISGSPTTSEMPDIKLAHEGPLIVGFWSAGREVVRVHGRGPTLSAAAADAGRQLSDAPALARLAPQRRTSGRLRVDLVNGRGPFPQWGSLAESLGLHPGVDGLGVRASEQEAILTPDDLVAMKFVSASRPVKLIDFTMGFDFKRAADELERRLEPSTSQRQYFRLQTDSFVEAPPGSRGKPPVALTRGVPPLPEVTASTLESAAIAGGRFLVRHLAPNGRYVYRVDAVTGARTDPKRSGPYSIPRHAGTTYFLAELYRHTGEEFLRAPIERAFAHLGELVSRGGCGGKLSSGARFACVVDRGQLVADLGSTSLTIVALVEYWRATKDDRFRDLAVRLSEWVLFMQRDDGSFAHRYHIDKAEIDDTAHLLYYSGEAALAMARMHSYTQDPRYLDAAERALDHLVKGYDFFLGGFFFGEEHWTCIAAEAAYPALEHRRYLEFCTDYAAFLRSHQVEAGDFPGQEDLTGSYMFTPFAMPANTPAGSRSEAMISTYQLARAHGKPAPKIRAQVLAALRFTLGQQIRSAHAVWAHPAASPIGGVTTNPTDRVVRIDYVQHVCSAMIRAADLIETEQLE